MSAIRFANTYRASPIRVPMYLEKTHRKYVKDCLSLQNNSEVYTSKKIKNVQVIDQSNDILSLMMYMIMSNHN